MPLRGRLLLLEPAKLNKLKKITKTYKVLLYSFLFSLSLLVALYYAFRSERVQEYLIAQLSTVLTDVLGTPVTVGGLDIELLNGIVLEELYVEDADRDTLASINELAAGIRYFDINKNQLNLTDVELRDVTFKLKIDSDGQMNLMRIINRFSSSQRDTTPSTKPPFQVKCNAFSLQNSKLVYKKHSPDTVKGKINFNNLEVSALNLSLDSLKVVGDSVTCNLSHLSFHEKSGFQVDKISAKTNISSKGIFLNNFRLKTPRSHVRFKKLYMATDSWGSYSDFIRDVTLTVDIRKGSNLHLKDINYVAGPIPISKSVNLSGQIIGPISSFSLLDFSLGVGKETEIRLSGNSFGLPDLPNTFWNISIDSFSGNIADIGNFIESVSGNLPSTAKRLGKFNFDGKIAGMTYDIVADINLNSWYGGVETDVKINQRDTTTYEITGFTKVNRLNLGYLLADTTLGVVSLKDTIQFVINTNGAFSLKNSGFVDSLQFNKYTYKNIGLVGEFGNKKFKGNLDIDDPNLDFNLDGEIDLSQEIPVFSFEAASKNIDLVALNFDPGSKLSRLNFDMQTAFSGDHLDNISGEIRFDTLTYLNDNGYAPFNVLSLYVGQTGDAKRMVLTSDYFGAYINGHFNFNTIGNAVMGAVHHFFPVLLQADAKQLSDALTSDNVLIDKKSNQLDTLQNFTFDFELGDINRIVQLFAPDVHIANYTVCNGSFNSAEQLLRFTFESDSIGVGTQYIDNPRISLDMHKEYLISNTTAKSISISEDMAIRNLKAYVQAQENDNRTAIVIDWDNRQDTLNFAGNVNMDFEVVQSYESGNLNYILRVNDSQLTVDKDYWHFGNAQMMVDTTSIFFDQLSFKSNDQSVSINGLITENKDDQLNLDILNFDLKALNPLLVASSTELGGKMSGSVELSNLLDKPMVLAQDSIEDFILNGDNIGNMYFTTEWVGDEKKLNVDLSLLSKIMQKNTFQVKGAIYPEKSLMDFNLELYKFKLHPLEGFLEGTLSGLRGSVSGKMKINGTFDKPIIDGKFGLRRVSATIDYLQTRYAVQENEIFVDNHRVQFDNAIIKDPRGQTALLDLHIKHSLFDSISIDMLFKARNFQVLKTTEFDNEMFYGQAYVSGDVKIEGPLDDMDVMVHMKPERNTKLYVPLSSTGSVSDYNFIEFDKGFDNENDSLKNKKEYEVDLSGMRLNLNLDITEDAEMEIIMDKKVGDIIRVAGEGGLTIDIDTKGDFFMFGEYKIMRGDYLFTLKNLINKKFEVKQGSSIRWSGDPLNAELNLNTLYRLKKIPVKDLYSTDDDDDDSQVANQSEEVTKKVSVDCELALSGSLEKPQIAFNLDINDDEVHQDINKLSEEERNKQFLSLLVMNRFMPLFSGGTSSGNAIGSNATELLSNQLSVWLSQMSDDFDMDVKYRMGDGDTQSEIEVGVSTELLDNRLSIQVSGNMNMGQSQETTTDGDDQGSSLEGDYEMSYKLTRNGKARAKYFGRANKVISARRIPFMQGVGFMYREDFDTFKELFKRYGKAILGRKDEEEEYE